MVYYKLVEITIDILSFAEVIINLVVKYYCLPNLIVTNRELLFKSEIWSLLYYFLSIKQKLYIIFNLQMDGLT